MDRTELLLEPRHLRVPSSASKMISMPMVCSVQTVHLSCTNTNNVSKQTKTRFHMIHVTYEFHRVRPKLFMSLWYVQYKPCTYLASRLALSPNGTNRAPPDPRHLRITSGASKMIYEPWYVWRKQSTYLTPTQTLSQNRLKRDSTQPHVTWEFHRVPPILFSSLRYIRRKPAPIFHQE
jgi:hypothetical protein